jgi:hypothetical protein
LVHKVLVYTSQNHKVSYPDLTVIKISTNKMPPSLSPRFSMKKRKITATENFF